MRIDKRLFLYLFIGIFFSTIAGILFHELGHWTAYRYYGYKARIAYNHTGSMANDTKRIHHLIELEYANKIDSNLDFPKKGEYETLGKELRKQTIVIGVAGPLLTVIAVAVAILILFLYRRNKMNKERLLVIECMCVFIVLFCIRSLFVRLNSDESKLSRQLDWYPWTIPGVMCLLSLYILWWITFKVIPAKQRSTFIAAFIAGEIAVWILWIQLLGPRLLP